MLSSPLCELTMRTLPPQISIAIAALMRPGRSSWNAASSIVTLPCLPRIERGREESPRILKPEAKSMRKALMCRVSNEPSAFCTVSSNITSRIVSAARLNACAHIAQSSMYSRVMSSE